MYKITKFNFLGGERKFRDDLDVLLEGETREVRTTELWWRHWLGTRSKNALLSVDFESRSRDHVRVWQRNAHVWVTLQISIKDRYNTDLDVQSHSCNFVLCWFGNPEYCGVSAHCIMLAFLGHYISHWQATLHLGIVWCSDIYDWFNLGPRR